MLAKRATLALLAVRTLSALASPVDLFTVQDPNSPTTSNSIISTDTGTSRPLDSNPEVHLDEGLFFGYRKAQIDHFLGIPFAVPP